MEKIPDEVRKQIEAESKDYMRSTLKGFVGDFDLSTSYLEYAHTVGAEFGYSLVSKALSDANKEIERRGELLVHWWKVANRIKEGEAKSILDADEFLEYQLAIEKKVEQFKTENNL